MKHRLIVAIIAALIAAACFAGIAYGQEPIPILWGAKKGLVRSGLAGAWNLGSVNQAAYSEDFSNALWTKSSTTATATVITATGNGGTITQSKASLSGGTYTLWAEIKRKTGTGTVSLQMIAGTTQACTINASTYSTCTLTYTATGVETLVFGFLVAISGDEFYVQKVQLHEGATAASYQATTDLQRVPVGTTGSMPIRREIGGAVVYDPAPDAASKYTYSNGETRSVTGTNLLTSSEALDNAAWTKDAALTLTQPSGYWLVASSADSKVLTTPAHLYSGAAVFTHSWQLQREATDTVYLVESDGINYCIISANTATGATSNVGGSLVCSASSVANSEGWRFSVTYTTGAGSILSACQLILSTGESVRVYHAQLNPGTLPDVYQKTEATTLEPGYPFLQLGSTAGVDTNDPARRLAGMVFDGTDDYLVNAAISWSQPSTIEMVAIPASVASNGVVVDTSATNRQLVYLSASNGRVHSFAGSDLVGTVNNFGGDVLDIVSLFFGANSKQYKNTVLEKSGDAGTNTATYLVVGMSYAATEPFNGTISHVGIWSKALSPREVRQNHQYYKTDMATKGVTLP